jgi:hypothetical protein
MTLQHLILMKVGQESTIPQQLRLTSSLFSDTSGLIPMGIGLETSQTRRFQMPARIVGETQQKTESDARIPMVMVGQTQPLIGLLTGHRTVLTLMHSLMIQHNGEIAIMMDLETILQEITLMNVQGNMEPQLLIE